jgi:Holliday junction resolvasome RuvABC endonuclease subunit
MTASLTRLETRLASSRRKIVKEAWEPPRRADFAPGQPVMAFDASLSNTGWVLLSVTYGGLFVHAKGTIRPQTELTGYRETWRKAVILRQSLDEMSHVAIGASHIAAEAPMVAGGHRTESSLVAGLQVVQWAAPRPVTDVGATHVSSVLLGSGRVPREERKAAIKAAVARYIPGSADRSWNEHERDAAAVGLTHLHDLARR